ncbi:MAG: hypothetical protein AAF698_08195, partial [Pseudomonadota bacterium]
MSIQLMGFGTWVPALAQTAVVEALDAPAGVAAASQVTPDDFSAIGLFMLATPTVKAVIIMLIVASFWSWAIMVAKFVHFGRVKRAIAKFETAFWSGVSLEELHEQVGTDPKTPIERVFSAGMTEWNRSLMPGTGVLPGTQARIERTMGVAIQREG